MKTASALTVGELAAKTPQAAHVLERFGIDYCCGGGQPLADACKSAGITQDELLQAIEQDVALTAGYRDCGNLTQRALINHIVEVHHAFTRNEIARIEALLQKVVSVHGTRHPELLAIQNVFGQLRDDLLPHMMKEENVLFPYIAALEETYEHRRPCPTPSFMTVRNPVRMMTMEHEAAGDFLRQSRLLSSDYTPPPDGCASYKTLYGALENFEKDLHQHIHLESNILFPRAIEMEANGRAS